MYWGIIFLAKIRTLHISDTVNWIVLKKHEDKVNAAVLEKRVKLHIFEPSQRKIWTIVGKGKEHWLDPSLDYCSCLGYYFGQINDNKECYHLESVKLAKKKDKVEIITFSDEEFNDFIAGLIADL